MPFTAAHPMAVLPIVRWRRLDATCLVIGSMAPDFEYFIHGKLRGEFGHTLPGLFGWCLPVTFALAALWHFVVEGPLRLVAPAAVEARTPPAARWPRSIVACAIATLIGAATHLAWDGLTHANGWAERWFPSFVDHLVDTPVLGPIPLFRVFQHISSAIGFAVVTWCVVAALRRRTPRSVAAIDRAGPRAIYLACTVAAIVVLFGRVMHSSDVGTLVVAPISGLLAGTLIASIAIRMAYADRLAAYQVPSDVRV